jgi:hypothetical protein
MTENTNKKSSLLFSNRLRLPMVKQLQIAGLIITPYSTASTG